MEPLSPLIQKLADVLQMSIDKLTEMYPTLMNEATWYTIVQNTRHLLGSTIIVSLMVTLIVGLMSQPVWEYDRDGSGQRRHFLVKVFKVEAFIGGLLGVIYGVTTIFGPLLYPNINLFTHLFK